MFEGWFQGVKFVVGRLVPFPLPKILNERVEAWEVVRAGDGLWAWAETASVARKLVRGPHMGRDLAQGHRAAMKLHN